MKSSIEVKAEIGEIDSRIKDAQKGIAGIEADGDVSPAEIKKYGEEKDGRIDEYF